MPPFSVSSRALLCAVGFALTVTSITHAADIAAPPSPDALPQVMVQAVTFTGNRAFSHAQLAEQLQADLGRSMGLTEMKALAAKIESFYREAGYSLAKVVVPSQDFSSQKALEMVVLEGWLGQVQVTGTHRLPPELVNEALREEAVQLGAPFTLASLERSLTHLNRLSGIEVRATLRPGEQAGSTDLQVEVTESPRVQGSIEMNNYGSKASGEHRLTPQLKFANLTGRGDEANVMAMTSLGEGSLWFGYLDYSLPLNTYGTKARAYYGRGNVALGSTYRVLEIQGDNTTWGVGVSHDWVRSERSTVTTEAWLEAQDLQQHILGVLMAQDNIRKLRLGLTWDNADLYGRTLVTTHVHYGLGEALGGMPQHSQMSSRAGVEADNRFTKLTFDLSRLQQITPRWLLIPRIAGQYASGALVSSEQWGIGGFNSVAGHAPSTYAGDHGLTASLEGRYILFADDNRYQATARLEHGQVWLKQGLEGQRVHTHLSGAALGLLARPTDRVDVRIDLGKPIGSRTEKSAYLYAKLRYHF